MRIFQGRAFKPVKIAFLLISKLSRTFIHILFTENTLDFTRAMLYNLHMKIFRYKFTKLMYAFIAVAMAFGIAVFAITLWQVIDFGLEHSAIQAATIVRYVLQFFVSVSLFVIALLFFTSSYYAIDGKKLKTSLGFLKSGYEIDKIDTVLLDRTTDKLSVIFEDDSCINVVIDSDRYDKFVQSILDVKPSIEYSIKSKTSTEDDDKKA